MHPDDSLSPSLGGDRATPIEPPAAPDTDAPGSEAPFGELPFGDLPLPEPFADLIAQVGQLAQAFAALVETVETHLPPTIEAVSGLVDALGESVVRALEDGASPPDGREG